MNKISSKIFDKLFSRLVLKNENNRGILAGFFYNIIVFLLQIVYAIYFCQTTLFCFFKQAMWLPGKSKLILSGLDQTWNWLKNDCIANILIPFVIVYENSEGFAMTANVDNVYSNSEHKNQSETEQRGYKVSTKYMI